LFPPLLFLHFHSKSQTRSFFRYSFELLRLLFLFYFFTGLKVSLFKNTPTLPLFLLKGMDNLSLLDSPDAFRISMLSILSAQAWFDSMSSQTTVGH